MPVTRDLSTLEEPQEDDEFAVVRYDRLLPHQGWQLFYACEQEEEALDVLRYTWTMPDADGRFLYDYAVWDDNEWTWSEEL